MSILRSTIIISLLIFFFLEHQANAQKVEVEMLPWEEVNEILPRYSKFTVIDFETGKKFKVQRRAGNRHADVQPITEADTKIMKEIYNGKWSWKRRAIIVLAKGKRIAASMHGMPHGAGALKNNFPGHFCIHFYGSKTHRTNFMDLSHKLMILKSAGRLDRYLANSSPYEATNAYLAGLKQQDCRIVQLTSIQALKWEKVFPKIENVTVSRIEVPKEELADELVIEVPISLVLQLKGIGPFRYDGNLRVTRFSPAEAWKADSVEFLDEIDIDFVN